MSEEKKGDFDNSAQFLIQQIIPVKITKQISLQKIKEMLQNTLPRFHRGTLEKHGYGFRILEIDENDIDEKYKNILSKIHENIISIKFLFENYGSKLKSVDDDGNEVREPGLVGIKSGYLHFYFPHLVYLQGAKETTNHLRNEFFRIMKGHIEIINLEEINHEFFS